MRWVMWGPWAVGWLRPRAEVSSASCLLSLHSCASSLGSTEILSLLSQPFFRVKSILKLCFRGMPSLYLNDTRIQMWVLTLKYYLDRGRKGFWGLFLFFHLHLISHYSLHFAKSLCKLWKEEKKKSNLKVSKQFCVRILLVPWQYQMISSCFLRELLKNMYSICSSTSSFSLEKVSTDLSGNFAWEENIVAVLYFVTFSDYSGLKSCSFSQFLWN